MSDTPDLRALHEATAVYDRPFRLRVDDYNAVILDATGHDVADVTDATDELAAFMVALLNASGHLIPAPPLPEVVEDGYIDWLLRQLPNFTDDELVAEIAKDPVAAMDNYRRFFKAFATLERDLRVKEETARVLLYGLSDDCPEWTIPYTCGRNIEPDMECDECRACWLEWATTEATHRLHTREEER